MSTMLPDGRRLGAHLAMADGMVKAGERAVEIGASVLQIFSDNPTAWERRGAASPEIPAFRAILERNDVVLAIHGSYLINLAGVDDGFHGSSVGLLAAELETARWFGARIVNIHIGSHRGAGVEAGIARLVDGLTRALAMEASTASSMAGGLPIVTLENSAGGGGGLGVDVTELAAIARALDDAGVPRERVGFCLDTAHLWGAGVDVAEPAAVDQLVRDFADTIGVDRLPLIHLNDTKAERASRMDRHEHLGAGRIGRDGLAAFLAHPLLAGTMYVIETPGMEEGYDAINVARARAIAGGQPLAPLPEGALTLRGSRARAATPPGSTSSPSGRRRRSVGSPASPTGDVSEAGSSSRGSDRA
jgi:deoxyribonuclease-4